MTTKEERGLEFFGLDNIKERVFAMVSKHMEKEQYKNLLADGKDMIDVYKSLKLEEEKNNMQRNARSNAFLKYLADVTNAAPTTKTSNLQLLRSERDEKLLTLFAETREGAYQANLHAGVKSILINSWKKKRRSPLSVFKQLKLDVKPTMDHSINVDLLDLWMTYVQEITFAGMQIRVFETISQFDNNVCMMVRGGLRKIMDTEWIVFKIEGKVLESWAEQKVPVQEVFNLLNLKDVKDEVNFDLWVKYVVKVSQTLTDEDQKAVANLSQVYNVNSLVKVVVALKYHDVEESLQSQLMETQMIIWRENRKTLTEVLTILDQSKDPYFAAVKNDRYLDLEKYVKENYKA